MNFMVLTYALGALAVLALIFPVWGDITDRERILLTGLLIVVAIQWVGSALEAWNDPE